MGETEGESTRVFREYLRINTAQPTPDYDGIVAFLENYAKSCGFKYRTFEVAPNRPVVIMTVEGRDPSLRSVLLNSHMDTGPVYLEGWKYNPFSAHKTENGDIYARGTQDMKCVGIQHLESMRMLTSEGTKLLRTVHLSFVPDEQLGGKEGMKIYVNSDDFKSLNVGFGLDEGVAAPKEEMKIFYSERLVRWGYFIAKGNPGHGSSFLEGTAGPKVQKIITKITEFRNNQQTRLESNPDLTLGDVSSINIVGLKGGVQVNVIPEELSVGFDLRATPSANEEIDKMLKDWCAECDVTLEWLDKQVEMGITPTDSEDKWWRAFSGALQACDVKYYRPEIFSAFSDARSLRHVGLPVLGFSPMNWTPVLMHENNEYLNEKVFERGVEIMKNVVREVANVSD